MKRDLFFMTAFLNFSALLRCAVLSVCTMTYIKRYLPGQLKKNASQKEDMTGASRIFYVGVVAGERLSPYISLMCLYSSVSKAVSMFV
jgi:hypothetical protein